MFDKIPLSKNNGYTGPPHEMQGTRAGLYA